MNKFADLIIFCFRGERALSIPFTGGLWLEAEFGKIVLGAHVSVHLRGEGPLLNLIVHGFRLPP